MKAPDGNKLAILHALNTGGFISIVYFILIGLDFVPDHIKIDV